VHSKTTLKLRTSEEVDASKKTDNPKGYLGISPGEFQVNRYTWSAPIVAGGLIGQFTELTFKGLGSAVSGLFAGDTAKATEQVTGPVGIFVVLQQGADLGIQFILMVIAIISLSLAIMNVLPIPALDGGRLFVTMVYRLLRRKLTERAEDMIHGTGFAALMLLFVLITIVDVKRFF
jgi:regulator of sigma E protease